MAGLRRSSRLPLWIAAAIVPAVLALVWLGWFVVDQDRRAAEDQAHAERRQAVDVGVSALARTLAEFERTLTTASTPGTPAAAADDRTLLSRVPVLVFDRRGVVARAGTSLPYYPAVSRTRADLPAEFARADAFEFAEGRAGDAILTILPFTRDDQPAVRAEAWLRLARNYRKAGDTARALDAFRELAALGDATVQETPAGLLGRTGRSLTFAAEGRTRELTDEARALGADLAAGRWRLTREQFEHSTAQLGQWTNDNLSDRIIDDTQAALIGAAVEMWDQIVRGGNVVRRQVIGASDTAVLAVSRVTGPHVAVMLVPARDIRDAWHGNVSDADRARMLSVTSADGAVILGTRASDAARRLDQPFAGDGLSWIVSASDASPAAAAALSSGARFMLAGIAFMILVVITSGYAVWRAVAREVQVARLQSDFVAAVSHEFRTPLTTIRQLSELLARSRVTTDDRKQQFYDAILSESERLQRLVENLLDFGRMEAGRLAYARDPVDLPLLLSEVAGRVTQDHAASGHRIEVRAATQVPPIRGDRDALGHAIRNLLDNAVKYSPEHKVIELSLAGEHDRVSIQVRDHGLGIPPAEQREIFERFVRGAASSARNIAGTGIGLAMARQIVEAHRGSIALKSAPGAGSTFTISLPAEPASPS